MTMASPKGSGIRIVVYDEHEKLQPLIRNAMIESVPSFNHLSSCMSFIEENTRRNEATVIVTTSMEDHVLKTFNASAMIEAIFISSKKHRNIDKLPSKVIGIYPEIDDLLIALFETLNAVESQLNANSFVFHRAEDGSDNLEFYFYNLWLNHEIKQNLTKKELVEQANIYFRSKKQIRTTIHEFNTNYNKSEVLHWLDRQSHPFPYYLLVSNALRTHDQHILALVRFFILDLTRQMKPLSSIHICNQTYYGTKLPITMVDRLEHQTINDIIAFQCFLPATKSRPHALADATRPSRRRKEVSVLFKIDASNAYGVHLGDIILIDMATPFHIASVSRYGDLGSRQELVTIVHLVAVDQEYKKHLHGQFFQKQKREGRTIEDFLLQTIPLLKVETKPKRENNAEIDPSNRSIPLYVVSTTPDGEHKRSPYEYETAGDKCMSRGEWTEALETFAHIDDPSARVLNKVGCILREHFQNIPDGLDCHQQALTKATDRERAETLMYLGIASNDLKQFAEALNYYSQALNWYEEEKPRDPAEVARCLVGLGNAHWACGQLDEALDCEDRALFLREHEVKPLNDFDIAGCLGNMGNILHDQGHMERAIACAKRAVDLLSKCDQDDPRLAAALNNLGAMYQVCGDYGKAREYFDRALDSVPDENHPYRMSILNNITRLNAVEQV